MGGGASQPSGDTDEDQGLRFQNSMAMKLRRASAFAINVGSAKKSILGGKATGPTLNFRFKRAAGMVKCVGNLNVIPTDLKDRSVMSMMKFIDGCPILRDDNLAVRVKQSLESEAERAERKRKRRVQIKTEAEEHMKRFDAMSEDERKEALHDGEMDLYSHDNQMKREELFESNPRVNAMLDRWWNGAVFYLDQDRNDVLTKKEYKVFFKRLMKLVEIDEDADQKEMQILMEQEFKSDSGGDGSVDRDEFRFAVFQLADHWTESVDADEYIEFLRKGYAIVYGDLIQKDKYRFPKSWVARTRKVRAINKSSQARCMDMVAHLLAGKVKSDKHVQDKLNSGRKSIAGIQSIEDYTITAFTRQFGEGKLFKKKLKSFYLTLQTILRDDEAPMHDYCLLYAQMAGIATESGSVTPIPKKAADFVVKHMGGIQQIMVDTRKKLKAKTLLGKRVSVNAKTESVIAGYMEARPTIIYLKQVLKDDLGLSGKDPLYRIAVLSLDAIIEDLDFSLPGSRTEGTERQTMASVVGCLRFTVLMGVIYSGWLEGQQPDN